MKADDVIAEVPCKTAEDFLNELNPLHGRAWARSRRIGWDPPALIFRGQRDATLPLRPAAFREDAFAPFIPGQVSLPMNDGTDQRNHEDSVVMEFCTHADHMGIHVPSDRPELRDRRRALPDYDAHEFPPVEKLHMFALAQHHGIPTRLLDWTERPLVAAYFAVEQIAKLRGKDPNGKDLGSDHRVVVWALNRGLLDWMVRKPPTPEPDPTIYVITAPRATNPNLHAQGGMFTLVQPKKDDPHPLPDLDVALKNGAGSIPSEFRDEAVLYKITLPIGHGAFRAGVALRLLSNLGIHAATVWPGLAGVAAYYRERWFHVFRKERDDPAP